MNRRWILPLAGLAIGATVAACGPVMAAAPGARLAAEVAPSIGYDWSGYGVKGPKGSFDSVSAGWTQPTATCHDDHLDPVSSPWVGLDGDAYAPKVYTIEQIGTDSDCDRAGKPSYYAWYDWVTPAASSAAGTVLKVPLKPGDKLSASVRYSAPDKTYTMTLADTTQHWSRTVSKQVPTAFRNSAEAIVEMPGGPLADFGAVPFSDVLVNGKPIGDFTQPGYTLQRMNIGLSAKHPHDICDSTSPLTGQRDFTVTWLKENGCSPSLTTKLTAHEVDGKRVLQFDTTLYTFSEGICSTSSCLGKCPTSYCDTTFLPILDANDLSLGPGVPGELGSVSTPLGKVYTYDGRPLYEYPADNSGKDLALGNGKHRGGGTWHDIVIGG